jgi:hypothetical protein
VYSDLDLLFSLAATHVITQYGAEVERGLADTIAANSERGDLKASKYGP